MKEFNKIIVKKSTGSLVQGTVVTVPRGYLEYLVKHGFAEISTKEKENLLEQNRIEREKQQTEELRNQIVLKEELEGKIIRIIELVNESGQFYQKISVKRIVDAINQMLNGESIETSQVVLQSKVKEPGIFPFFLKLKQGIKCSLFLNAQISENAASNAEKQLKKSQIIK